MKKSLLDHKNSDALDINAGAGWHIAGLWTFLLALPVPWLLHHFLKWNSSNIGLAFLAIMTSILLVQFEAFRKSNGILRPIALASTLFYGLFLYSTMPR